jgi:glycine cleavage system aminomethyltransferase T/NADPH-dependent 2,4-dienoyl-CoA reductase/sulfur reductase-like enzyme
VKQRFRLASGGRIDRTRPISFTFDGLPFEGYAGDTLASALLANGVHMVARSFKYHRPRGIYTAGVEEPNALVQLGTGARSEPNVRATTQELYEGLVAESQNRMPSLRYDVGGVNDALSRFLPAGFYYKTFMWPRSPRWWLRYEHAIRRMAGMGRASTEPDPDTYEHQYAHCDVLVVGAGHAGLEAARAAAAAGASVIVCDERPPALDGEIANVTTLARTTVFGVYDGMMAGAVERVTDHLATRPPNLPRQRLWKIRAREIVLATGAIERGIAYAGNDLPGTMLAGAARTYVERYGVAPGRRAVVFTNNDTTDAAVEALRDAGVAIAAIVDARESSLVVAAHGRRRVRGVDVGTAGGRRTTRVECDLVCVSGGWNPAVHLYSQARGTLRYDERIAAFVPDACPVPVRAVGAAAGHVGVGTLVPVWSVPHGSGKRFVDLQNDVTADDVALAAREGYTSVEHLKRYTTLGMGTDQGKTSNVVGLALLSQAVDRPIPEVGTTTFRPPYAPVALGAVAGAEQGAHLAPTRRTAMHDWHAAQGARFVTAGLWLRPHSYPHAGESEDDAANREARNVRTNAGVVDVSTLGKIELAGRDCVTFLDRVYANAWQTLAVGRCRYGVMLRDDGMVMDDGTVTRLADAHFLVTTTTVNAVRVMQHFEYLLQAVWPELDVYAASVTEQWAAAAIAGPRARDVVARLVDIDVGNAAFPFLAFAECRVGALPARLFRISYSGELAYEIHVPADLGTQMWQAIVEAGKPFGLMPYGTEAMGTLRIEKGHIVVGPEADGRTTADDLGLGKLVSARKWCIGKPMLDRPALREAGRWQLVGLTALDGAAMPRAAKVVADPDRPAPNPMLGHVTSWCYSPNLGKWIALALVADGRARHGETLWAVSPLAGVRVRVEVGPAVFIDPEGARLRC